MCVRLLTYDMTPDSHVTCLTILSHALHAVTRLETGMCVSIEAGICVTRLRYIWVMIRFYTTELIHDDSLAFAVCSDSLRDRCVCLYRDRYVCGVCDVTHLYMRHDSFL